MNVGHPSNLARFFDLYGGTVDRTGVVHVYPDLKEMRRRIFSVSISDEETKKTIRRVYEQYNLLLEPHGAVGWKGSRALPGGLLRAHRGALRLPRDGPPGQVPRRDHRASRHHPRGAPEHEGPRQAHRRARRAARRLRPSARLPAGHAEGDGLRDFFRIVTNRRARYFAKMSNQGTEKRRPDREKSS